MDSITITRPDDWHIHLRDGDFLPRTVADVARTFGRAIVMPNLVPPVVTCADAQAYKNRIVAQIPAGSGFTPLMTLYLTDNTPATEIDRAAADDAVYAVKYYPAGATTNSDSGVTDITRCYAALEKLAEHGIPLLVHGEVTSPEVDIFDREKIFIDRVLAPLAERFATLRIVLEHITTADAVEFVADAAENIAATITAHHLHFNRNHMLAGGIRPHYYCLPILKRNTHQQALRGAAVSGNPRFFLGTDSAPHLRSSKETGCGCAGCYTAPAALELYAECFDQMQALDKLEDFASHFGADFYNLPRNRDRVRLERSPWQLAAETDMAGQPLVPLRAGETINWTLSAVSTPRPTRCLKSPPSL